MTYPALRIAVAVLFMAAAALINYIILRDQHDARFLYLNWPPGAKAIVAALPYVCGTIGALVVLTA